MGLGGALVMSIALAFHFFRKTENNSISLQQYEKVSVERDKAVQELHNFRQTLYPYLKKHQKPHKFINTTYTYTCLKDGNDIAHVKVLIHAEELLWCSFIIKRTALPPWLSCLKPRFEDLQFEAFSDQDEIAFEVVEETADRYTVCLFLDPPIGGNKDEDKLRNITYKYVWLGLWEELRQNNRDRGEIKTVVDSDDVTLCLKFPREDLFGKVRLQVPQRGKVHGPKLDESGFQKIVWKIGNVSRDESLEYKVIRKTSS
jgi:hypothetical protein